jgi:pilus assembly protein CpaD
MTFMSRTAQLLAFSLAALAAAGCTSPPLQNAPEHFFDVEAMYPISVEPQVATLVVGVDEGLHSLGRGEDERVHAFVEQWKMRGQGILSAASPTGTARDAAAGAALAQLKKLLAAQGVDKGSVQYTSYKPANGDANAPITLSFVTYVANAADCGTDWSENLGFTPRNLPWPDFGCSTQHNFAALVADPRDLIEPHASDRADAQRRNTVLDKYREGMPTGAMRDRSDSGQVSVVGR